MVSGEGIQTTRLQALPVPAANRGWLRVGRVAWLLTLLATLGLFAVGIPVITAEMLTVCEGPACYRWQPSPQLVTDLTGLGLPVTSYLMYVVGLEIVLVLSFCAIATVLVWRRPDEPMALFAAFMLVIAIPWTDYVGFGMSAVFIAWHYWRTRRPAVAAAA